MLAATTIVTPVSPRAPYILGSQKSFGPRSWPVLCGVVQGVAIFASRAAVAVAASVPESEMKPTMGIILIQY